MKKIGMFSWAVGFALLLGVTNANSGEISEGMAIRIGVLSTGASRGTGQDQYHDSYHRHLRNEIGRKPNREVLRVPESKGYPDLDIEKARTLGQAYEVDMVIGVAIVYERGRGWRGYTKLVDISARRLVELKPVNLGSPYIRPGSEKKLVKKQMGAIEKMIEQISQEKRKSKP